MIGDQTYERCDGIVAGERTRVVKGEAASRSLADRGAAFGRAGSGPPCKRGWGDERSESSVIPLLRDVESAYGVMSLTCVAIYQVLPNGSVTAEVRSP